MSSSLIRNLARPLVSDLQSADPIAYDDHTNLWTDFGCDISSGDGEIAEMVADRVASLVESLSPTVQEYLWWNLASGKRLARQVEDFFEHNPTELKRLSGPDREEIIEDVTGAIIAWLIDSAESNYDAFVEAEWQDKEDDTEDIDDWGDDKEDWVNEDDLDDEDKEESVKPISP